MSFIGQIDAEMQKELLEFVKSEEDNKNPKPLKYGLVAEIFKQILHGEREITGLATNHKSGDVFVRFSFTKEVQNDNLHK